MLKNKDGDSDEKEIYNQHKNGNIYFLVVLLLPTCLKVFLIFLY